MAQNSGGRRYLGHSLPCKALVLVNEADSRGHGAPRDTYVHQDIVPVTAGQRDEAAIGHRPAIAIGSSTTLFCPNMSQSRYGCSHLGGLDSRARRGLEDRNDDVVFVRTA